MQTDPSSRLLPISIIVVTIFCTFVSTRAEAKDFGKRAQDFNPTEEPFLEMIQKRLQHVDIKAEQEKQQSIAKERVKNPLPVAGAKRAEESRAFYFDPTHIVKEDIKLPCGKILHKAGTSVNPLDHMSLDRRIYIIDGRDQDQVDWLEEELVGLQAPSKQSDSTQARTKIENRIILVGGSPLEIEDRLGQKIYFDQAGEIVRRMKIEQVPAKLEQEGRVIKIEEIAI